MARVTNTGDQTLHWNALTNMETGRTLELAPGESAEVDISDGFTDPYLKTDDELGDYEPPAAPEEASEEAPEPPAPMPPGAGSVYPSASTDTPV